MREVEEVVVQDAGCGEGVAGSVHGDSGSASHSPQAPTHPVFRHQSRDQRCVFHRDDFQFARASDDLTWVAGHMGLWCEVKVRGTLGPGEGDQKSTSTLNR